MYTKHHSIGTYQFQYLLMLKENKFTQFLADFWFTVFLRLDLTLVVKSYLPVHLCYEFYKVEYVIVIDRTLKHVIKEFRENVAALKTQIS